MIRNSTQHVCPIACAREKAIRAAIAVMMAVVVSGVGRAGQFRPIPSVAGEDARTLAEILHDQNVISAVRAAWKDSGIGTIGLEGGFRLDGSPSDYRIVILRRTNEFKCQKLAIVPETTFAVFHVHPTAGDFLPSLADQKIADTYRLKIIAIHIRGIYEYDPATRKTLRIGDLVGLLK